MKYDWKRFWCPREGTINLGDEGFLVDPESEHALWLHPNVVPFEKLRETQCLALLGEPGIGKSEAINSIRDEMEKSLQDSSATCLFIDLNDVGEEGRLIKEVFENEKIIRWEKGDHILHLILDSLDECKIQIKHVGMVLFKQLKRLQDHLPRLRFRIVSRTADWPMVLENGLRELWGDNFKAYELVPLRKKDVQIAAEAEGIVVQKFFEEISQTNSAPFAIKPITLKFLLSGFASGGFPKSREALYEMGCLRLCEETNQNRVDLLASGAIPNLPIEEKLRLAARIAGIFQLCKKTTILLGSSQDGVKDGEIPLAEILIGDENFESEKKTITENQIRGVLGTSLFSSRGQNRMGFSHQTYSEFLASYYLKLHSVQGSKILPLFENTSEVGRGLIPQLYETASWVAGWNQDFFSRISRTEPQVLLRGDCENWTDADRSRLVDSLLIGISQGEVNYREIGPFQNYEKVKHGNLAKQLKPWLTDKTKSEDARSVALRIGAICKTVDLANEVSDLALDISENLHLRKDAAWAVAELGEEYSTRKMLPLVYCKTGDDSQDELKGYALKGLWPRFISPKELFDNLTLPKDPHFFGGYSSFVRYHIHPELTSESLPIALEWLTKTHSSRSDAYCFQALSDETVLKSWDYLETPPVFERFVELCIEFLKSHHPLIHDPKKQEENKENFGDQKFRRKVSKAIIESSQGKNLSFLLRWEWPHFIRNEDFDWCLQELFVSKGKTLEEIWVDLSWFLFRQQPESSFLSSTMIEARKKCPRLFERTREYFDPVELGSERAKKLKAEYEEELSWKRKPETKKLDWPPSERAAYYLDQFEKGKMDAWWALLREMTLEETSTHYNDGMLFGEDFYSFPGWKNKTDGIKERIIASAWKYLEAKPEIDFKGVFRGSLGGREIAGFRALQLISDRCSDEFSKLSSETFSYWLPVSLYFYNMHFQGDSKKFLSIAQKRVPQRLTELFIESIVIGLEKGEPQFNLKLAANYWSSALADFLYEKLADLEDKPLFWGQFLRTLVINEDRRAIDLALAKLSLPYLDENQNEEIVLQSGNALLSGNRQDFWKPIWEKIQTEPEFGKRLLMCFSYGLHGDFGEFALRREFCEIADLYIWLARNFPYEQDPHHTGSYTPDEDDAVRDFRNFLLRKLEKSGSPFAFRALEKVVSELKEYHWLKTVLLEARQKVLEKTWLPLSHKEFILSINKPEARVVRNASDLQDLLIETLEKIEVYLHGETSAVPALWNEWNDLFRPKTENQFSDWMKLQIESHLKGVPVVAAREVEIRSRMASQPGERTDILVSAMVPSLFNGQYEKVQVIIEVKGCWHDEVKTGMQTQLVERYLEANQCKNGIFLVGWFLGGSWDDADSRKKSSPKISIREARQLFSSQAHDLSQKGFQVVSFVMDTSIGEKEDEKLNVPRPFGLAAGQFVVPDDFNDPLPEEIIRDFEGK